MLGSETIEVGIGMAFLFLMASLVCTAVKEWLEGIFKWRAMDLERALRTLLDDATGAMTSQLLDHPQIFSLFQGRYDPGALRSSWMTPGGSLHMRLSQRRHLPSYIPAAQFATAFLDHVARGAIEAAGAPAPGAAAALPLSIDSLRERAAAATHLTPYLQRAVLSAIDHAAGDLDRVHFNIERWFDGTMDRAAGWYKRRTQSVLFLLGFGIAVALNLDALHVMRRLTIDKTFREVVVKEAEAAKAPAPSESAATAGQSARIYSARAELDRVGMPIGWKVWRVWTPGEWYRLPFLPQQLCLEAPPANPPEAHGPLDCTPAAHVGYTDWARIVVGWLATAFAVMLGAPFWFDVLNKFMVVRSTVKPHEKSPEEASEDRQPAGNGAAPAPQAAPAAPPPQPQREPSLARRLLDALGGGSRPGR